RQFAGMTCADLARECLRRAGIPLATMSPPAIVARAMNVTADYPALLGDVVGRSLRDAYKTAPSALREVALERTANDFRMQTRVALDSSGFKLLPLPESGEFKYASFLDSKESYRLGTFGRIFSISRQALTNDDLGGFSSLSTRLGVASAVFEA